MDPSRTMISFQHLKRRAEITGKVWLTAGRWTKITKLLQFQAQIKCLLRIVLKRAVSNEVKVELLDHESLQIECKNEALVLTKTSKIIKVLHKPSKQLIFRNSLQFSQEMPHNLIKFLKESSIIWMIIRVKDQD